jgi:anti-sigma factor RsiW
MKTFEEKWTAWLDGQLSDRELAEFEASLPDKAAAEAEKAKAKKLGALLKRELGASALGRLTNEEFFSYQIHERIAREHAGESRKPGGGRIEASTWWTIRRLLWTGTASLAVFLVMAIFVRRDQNPAEQSQYLTQILNARVDPVVSPNATISMFETKEDRVTVLWTEGLQSLPADYAAK